jgi:signal peptidase II
VQERGTVATLTRPSEPATDRHRPPPGAGRRLAVAAGVAATVVLVDQLTKWWAVDRLTRGPIHVGWTLDLELTRNTGSAFSLFQGDAVILVVVAVVLVTGLLLLVRRWPSTGRAAVLGLIVGGALGNLSDRLFRDHHGAVVDFVALHWWPTFNVADASIVVGCALLVVSLLRAGGGG